MTEQPKCNCFQQSPADMENIVYAVARGSLMAFDVTRASYGICEEGFDYVAVTLVAMLLRTIAGRRSGDMLNCEHEFQKLLLTLVDDVKMRDEILNALLQRIQQGSTTQ